jgi:DNA-binding CsgD family transcriptional regulator/Holliday junction resolvase
MSREIDQDLVRDKILQLVNQYERHGYEVYADIPGHKQPEKIEGVIPNIIVKKGNEVIILEVKSNESIKKDKDQIFKLAQYAKQIPGCRFDLVTVNTSKKTRTSYKAIREELRSLKGMFIESIEKAIDENDLNVAIVLISGLLESFLIRLAEENNISTRSEQRSFFTLAENLVDSDIISPAIKNLSIELLTLRNRNVHTTYELIPQSKVYQLYQNVSSFVRQNDRDFPINPELQKSLHLELTRREMEILNFVANGKTNSEIAESLYIDVRTIQAHINNIYIKLSSNERAFGVNVSKLSDKRSRIKDFIETNRTPN